MSLPRQTKSRNAAPLTRDNSLEIGEHPLGPLDFSTQARRRLEWATSAQGSYNAALLPFVKGKRSGKARFVVTANPAKLELSFLGVKAAININEARGPSQPYVVLSLNLRPRRLHIRKFYETADDVGSQFAESGRPFLRKKV